MTITAQTSKTGPYNGNGTTTVFSYTFEVQDEAHLVVTLADASGVETVQVLNTDYTVSGVGNPNGGQITMSTAPASTYTLTISRNVPITQEVDLENRRSVAPEVLEDAYDKLTQIAQDLSEQIGRAIKVSVTEGGNPTLSLQGDVQPNTFLGFDASGNLAQLAPASGTFISPNAALVQVDDFTGDGTTVDFTLGGIPLSPNNLFIFLDGVMQDAANYTVSGTTLTFTTAPPLNTNIEVRRLQAVALTGGTTADLVTYSPAGSGAVPRTVQSRLRDFVSVKDFGAVGDGVTDDTAAFASAIGAYATAKTIYIPAGTYLITSALNLGINKKIIGAGARDVQINFDSSTDAYFMSGDAFSHVEGLSVTRISPAVPQTAFASYTPTTANGWRNGVLRDVVINSFNYGIGSTQLLTQGLMFQNVYERVRIYYADVAVQMGSGSNANTFINCEFWYSNTRDVHLNNVTTINFVGCGFEDSLGTVGSANGLVEASNSVKFDNCYFEPARGVVFDTSSGSFDTCHSTAFDVTLVQFLTAQNNSTCSINDFSDYNFGSTSTGSMKFYAADATSKVYGLNTFTQSGTEKVIPASTDGVISEFYQSGDWFITKYGNGLMTLDMNTDISTNTLIMTSTTATYNATLTLPVSFTSGAFVAQASIFANAAAAFLLVEDPRITVRPTGANSLDIRAERTYSSFVDGYFYSIRCIGRWK